MGQFATFTLGSFVVIDLIAATTNAFNGALLARQPSHYRNYTVVGILLLAIFGKASHTRPAAVQIASSDPTGRMPPSPRVAVWSVTDPPKSRANSSHVTSDDRPRFSRVRARPSAREGLRRREISRI